MTSRPITLSEELRENAERDGRSVPMEIRGSEADGLGVASQAITVDSGCDILSFSLYNLPNNTGNKICFSGTGIVDLSTQVYLVGTPPLALTYNWGTTKQSYQGGGDVARFQGGGFSDCTAQPVKCGTIGPLETANSLDSCEASVSNRFLNIGLNEGCRLPWATVGYLSPMNAQGHGFTRNGWITANVLRSNGTELWTPQNLTADANGDVAWSPYTNSCQGSACPGCGQTVKFTDMTRNLTATAPISHACY